MEHRKKVTFIEKTHQYFLEDSELPSVSKIIKRTHEEFDSKGTATRMSAQGKGTVSDILAQWKEAADQSIRKGNALHDLAELIVKIYDEYPSVIPLLMTLVKILKEYPNIIGAEKKVYSEEFWFAGMVDLLLYNGEKVIMYDYKTNKDLYKNFRGKRMLAPFDDLLDCPASKYFIQQNMYAIALEEEGIYVDEMYLLWVRDDEVERVIVPDLKDKIKQWLK